MKKHKKIGRSSIDTSPHYIRDKNGVETFIEYDKYGNEIHRRRSDGYEKWAEFNEYKKITHIKFSNGYERWCDYNMNGVLLSCHDSLGYVIHYNTFGNVRYMKNPDGYEFWQDYDVHGRLIRFRNSEGADDCWTYNKYGKLKYYKGKNFEEKYDRNGNVIYTKICDGSEFWNSYKNGNKTHVSSNCGYEMSANYDNRNKCIYFKDSNGNEWWADYDLAGENTIITRYPDGSECWVADIGSNKGVRISENNLMQTICNNEY